MTMTRNQVPVNVVRGPGASRRSNVVQGYRTQSTMISGATATVTTATALPSRVSHRELLATVVFDNPITTHTYTINARNATTFPWLSVLAQNYDMYHLQSLSFEYMPECGSTTVGGLVMAFDYDVSDDNTATTFEQLSAYAGAVTGQLYVPMRCAFAPNNTVIAAHKYFCKAGGGRDRLSDVASFVWRINAPPTTQTGTTYGKIYAKYVVDLYNPELSVPNLLLSGSLVQNTNSTVPVPTTAASPLGTADVVKLVEQIGGFDTTSLTQTVSRQVFNNPQLLGQAINYVTKSSLSLMGYPDLTAGWKLVDETSSTDVAFADIANEIIVANVPRMSGDLLLTYRLVGDYTPFDPVNAPSPLVNLAFNNATLVVNAAPKFPNTQVDDPLIINNLYYLFGYMYLNVINRGKPVGIALGISPSHGTWNATLSKTSANSPPVSWISVCPVAHTMAI